ncbi:MAG TPA: BamA/TamA family outer membrane protein [Gemmatimonadaceae bacterium]|jgi:hypothetical protein|nr:BamA/TamA family outer membrane protein [Gemmatimonadaceae bacterium]
MNGLHRCAFNFAFRGAFAAAATLLGAFSLAGAQDPTPGVDLPTDARSPGSATTSRIAFIPVFGAGPTFGFGAGVVAAWRFRLDSTSQRSAVGVGGIVAQRESWIASIGGRAYAHHDDWIFLAGVEQYSAEYNFYGVGDAAGNTDQAELVRQQGNADMVGVLRRVYGHLYLGPQYRFDDTKAKLTHDGFFVPFRPMVIADSSLSTAGLGAAGEYDSRDDDNAPRHGTYARATAMFNGSSFGGDRAYNAYNGWLNQYIALPHKAVLAARVDVCDAGDGAPFYTLCLFGAGNDLRGYVAGRYRDNAMYAAQAEYRSALIGRFSWIAFGGVGAVSHSFSDLWSDQALVSGGPGIRYLLSGTHKLNLGADYAFANHSSGAFYFRIGEAY